jgi:2-amino-4-hydroxy-6-hydroxymethyldihydropteridine diphosphokinase
MNIYLLLGSNINPVANIKRAILEIEGLKGVSIMAKSSLYETEPVGILNQPWFINCCLEVSTFLSPRELLCQTQGIEEAMERKREIRWGPRVIDIDILYFGEKVISDNDLTIPHPELHRRLFALIPLAEIAQDFLHPILKVGIKELISNAPPLKVNRVYRKGTQYL